MFRKLSSLVLVGLASCSADQVGPVALADTSLDVKLEAPSGVYVSDPTHTSVHWRVGHMGLSQYTARINQPDIRLEFDRENLAASEVKATFDPLQIDTGFPLDEPDWDGEVASGEKLLNAGRYPEITFVSTRVELTGDTTAEITGDLTLLGVTRPVTMAATYSGSVAEHPFAGNVPAIGFHAVGAFDRRDFGMTEAFGGSVDWDVTIEVQAEFVQQSES